MKNPPGARTRDAVALYLSGVADTCVLFSSFLAAHPDLVRATEALADANLACRPQPMPHSRSSRWESASLDEGLHAVADELAGVYFGSSNDVAILSRAWRRRRGALHPLVDPTRGDVRQRREGALHATQRHGVEAGCHRPHAQRVLHAIASPLQPSCTGALLRRCVRFFTPSRFYR